VKVTDLLDHLSLFESLISLPPEELLNTLHPYISICTAVGRYFILIMFMMHLTSTLVMKSYDTFKKNLLPDIYKLLLLMAIFGNPIAYNLVIQLCITVFNLFSESICRDQVVAFKGSFRAFIDAIAEQSTKGIDFFDVKASTATVLTLLITGGVMIMLITYYVFVSLGMFELLIFLAIGPVIAGFLFFLKTPFARWCNAILACLLFPVFTAVALTIINQAGIIVGLQEHLIMGSFVTLLLQLVLAIAFFDLVILFHSALFGVNFGTIPVVVKSIFMALIGNVFPGFLNGGFILSTVNKGK